MTALSKSALKTLWAARFQPTSADFSDLIDSWTDYSEALSAFASAAATQTGIWRVTAANAGSFIPVSNFFANFASAASTTAAAQAALGATTIGAAVFTAANTAAATGALGGNAVGVQIFGASTTADVVNIVGQSVSAATRAEVSAATSSTVYVSPATMADHPGAAKAWGWFSVTANTVTLRSSYNVSTVSSDTQGVYRVTLSTPMAVTAYSVQTSWSGTYTEESTAAGYGYVVNPRSKKLNSFLLYAGSPSSGANTNPQAAQDGEFYFVVHGPVS